MATAVERSDGHTRAHGRLRPYIPVLPAMRPQLHIRRIADAGHDLGNSDRLIDHGGGLVVAPLGPRPPHRRLPAGHQRHRLLHGDARAVCHGWRSATAVDPRAQGAAGAADPRSLLPHQWIMLEEESSDCDGQGGDARLFVYASTGRFHRRRVPLLRDRILVAASDGLLLLGDKSYPRAASVLNPFTGSLLRFSAPIPVGVGRVIASVTNYDPMLVFAFETGSRYDGGEVMCADPTSQRCGEQFFRPVNFNVASLVSHACHAYMVDMEGEREQEDSAKISLSPLPVNSCSSDVILVNSQPSRFSDSEGKALEAVKNTGGRALFLGDRSLSVNADVLPSVDGNCVYYTSGSLLPSSPEGMYRHYLEDGIEEKISGDNVTDSERPFSLVQVLITYCRDSQHSLYFDRLSMTAPCYSEKNSGLIGEYP
uniref:KIB1-4 beta-propeller domain-containing protein n=1 Tax=Setaria italica TaxID=4555 RepID=K4A368_SETIT